MSVTESIAESPPVRQFRLVHVFWLVAMVAAEAALGSQLGLPGLLGGVSVGCLALTVAYAWQKRWGLFAVASACLIVVVFGLLLPGEGVPREAARRVSCSNNVKNIVLALHNYHDRYHAFPPAYVTDKAGKPLYSWRVLLLPYFESNADPINFHFDEPWDSPHNLKFAREEMPRVYGCPNRPGGRHSTVTSYVAVTGDETMWPGSAAMAFDKVTDGTSHTLLIVEWPESDVVWTEPRDLPMKDIRKWWFVSPKVEAGEHRHGAGVYVGYADGRTSFLSPRELSGKQLRSLLTPAGDDATLVGDVD
jgi:hypothetical protein